VANRSVTRARDLVHESTGGPFEMRAVPLDHVATELAEADVVLSAVAAESHVLGVEDFATVAGPLLVIDLGVPRNVDPAVAALDDVTVLDMDTLGASVARALGDRQEESVAARRIVACRRGDEFAQRLLVGREAEIGFDQPRLAAARPKLFGLERG